MECVKVCEYLARFGSYPKKYVRQIYNNLSIVKGNRQYNKFINSCSLCGLCYEVCPEDLHMGTVCKNARQTMVKQGRMPPSAHDFALRDMQFSNSETFALARNKPGTTTSDFVFFPGCQLSASAPEYVEKVYAYLMNRLPARVGLMLRCCGVPAEWAGRTDVFQAALTDFRDRHLEMGNPRLVLACSSCYQVFKTHLPDVEVVSLWQLFDTLGLPSDPPSSPDFQSLKGTRSLAVHDPCTTRYDRVIHDSVRNILHRLGYQIDELPLAREKTECCSYGGLMWLANPELASAIVRRRIQEHPADYVTYCAMCRDFFASRGKRTLHLLDLIYRPPSEADARAIRGGPGYSQRHENRARLKRKLLKEVWGEEMAEQKRYEAIKLIIPDEVQERLEERLILVEDIQQVIDFAESTGSKLLNRRTHHFLAYNRPASVTYWVEYSPHADAFVVHNAYSHRMEIVADVKT
jgi:Fe-S oxidoreductase